MRDEEFGMRNGGEELGQISRVAGVGGVVLAKLDSARMDVEAQG